MPFEFNGAPPALLDSAGAFSSFATPSQTISTPPTAAVGTSQSFPGPAHLPSASPSPLSPAFGAAASFGSTDTPAFRSTLSWPSSPLPPQCNALTSATSLSPRIPFVATTKPEPQANDPLPRALTRALKGRFAIFGRVEITADGILKNILRDTDEGKRDIQALLAGLRQIETSSPVVADFIRALFDEFIRVQTPEEEQPTKEATPPPSNDPSEAKPAVVETPDESTTPSDLLRVEIPRNNWRPKTLSKHLAQRLLDEGYIWYPEGARILADHILDLCYGHCQEAVAAKVVALLAREDINDAVENIVYWARCRLRKMEDDYLLELDRADPHTVYAGDLASKVEGSPAMSRLSAESQPQNASSDEGSQTGDESEEKPFRFLDLPAELRNCVYRELMAPGYIGLDQRGYSEFDSERVVKRTRCAAEILCTSRQIHHEAKDILFENTICVTGTTAHGMLPVISQKLLPTHALPKQTSLMLTMVMLKSANPLMRRHIHTLHWKQFQHMTGLKQLRICIVEREDQVDDIDDKKAMLKQILERIPKDCEVSFEASEGFEDEFVQGVIEKGDAERVNWPEYRISDAYEVEGELLNSLAQEFKSEQGCKSGSTRDFRFPDRAVNLKPLVPVGDTNPSIVLGGGQ